MRGLRSLIVLLVIAIPLGWYAYRDSTKPADSGAPKRDKVFTVEADKIEEISLKSESGERTRLQKSGNEWKIVAPAGRATRLERDLQRRERHRLARDGARDRRESAGPQGVRPGAAAHRGHVQGRRQRADPAPRSEDAAGDRSLREARRRNEGLPHPRPSRVDLQQDHVRSARQVGGQGRSRQARRAGVHGRRQDLAVREARR